VKISVPEGDRAGKQSKDCDEKNAVFTIMEHIILRDLKMKTLARFCSKIKSGEYYQLSGYFLNPAFRIRYVAISLW
jgi:hypothetical protein